MMSVRESRQQFSSSAMWLNCSLSLQSSKVVKNRGAALYEVTNFDLLRKRESTVFVQCSSSELTAQLYSRCQ